MQKRRTSHPAYVALATGATEQLEARRLRLDLLTELPSVNYCVAGQRMTYAAEAAGRIKEANDAHRDPITVDIEAPAAAELDPPAVSNSCRCATIQRPVAGTLRWLTRTD